MNGNTLHGFDYGSKPSIIFPRIVLFVLIWSDHSDSSLQSMGGAHVHDWLLSISPRFWFIVALMFSRELFMYCTTLEFFQLYLCLSVSFRCLLPYFAKFLCWAFQETRSIWVSTQSSDCCSWAWRYRRLLERDRLSSPRGGATHITSFWPLANNVFYFLKTPTWMHAYLGTLIHV